LGDRISSLHTNILEQHQSESHKQQKPHAEALNVDEHSWEILDTLKKCGGAWDHPESKMVGTV
jgi:hypothetical protein